METYNFPYYRKSGFKWYVYLLYFILIICLTASSGFFLIIMRKDEFVMSLFCSLFSITLDILFIYMLIYVGILKKCFIEMTSEYLRISTPYKTHKVYWNEIYEVNMFYYNHNTIIGVLLEKDRLKKQKRTILNSMNSIMGFPSYSFQIGLALFKDVNKERLLETIAGQINKNPKENYFKVENVTCNNEEKQNNIFKAIITSILICIILSAIYGFSIYKLEENYVAIPMFGSLIIISFFNKYYLEESFKLSIRLFLASLCVCQILVAIVGFTLFAYGVSFSIEMVQAILIDHFHDLIRNFSGQLLLIFTYVLCFGFGFFRGRK